MTQRIIKHLNAHPSYFKWSASRLARKYNCSERTVKKVINILSKEKQEYLTNLK